MAHLKHTKEEFFNPTIKEIRVGMYQKAKKLNTWHREFDYRTVTTSYFDRDGWMDPLFIHSSAGGERDRLLKYNPQRKKRYNH